MPIAPAANPYYARHAVLPRAKELLAELPEKPKKIALLIGKSDDPQVVYRILKGKNVSYPVVHRLFTYCSIRLGRDLDRCNSILPVPDPGSGRQLEIDPEVRGCLVFHGLHEMLVQKNIRPEDLASRADVGPAYVERLITGSPVAANLVEAIAKAFESLSKETLDRRRCLFT